VLTPPMAVGLGRVVRKRSAGPSYLARHVKVAPAATDMSMPGCRGEEMTKCCLTILSKR
jgi:hypothetical protein